MHRIAEPKRQYNSPSAKLLSTRAEAVNKPQLRPIPWNIPPLRIRTAFNNGNGGLNTRRDSTLNYLLIRNGLPRNNFMCYILETYRCCCTGMGAKIAYKEVRNALISFPYGWCSIHLFSSYMHEVLSHVKLVARGTKQQRMSL